MDKNEKVAELIRELAAEFFSRESNRTSLITITSVDVVARGGRAIIKATVLPESEEKRAVEFMSRKLGEFQEYVRTKSRIGRIPYFEVMVDTGEKNRQRIDTISENLE